MSVRNDNEWKFGCFSFSIIVILILLFGILYSTGIAEFEYSDGTRSGVVYKFSKKGIIWKTYEGQLSLGLTEKDSDGNLVPIIFDFSCDNEEAAEQINLAEQSGKRVILHYKQYIFPYFKKGNTAYRIIKVENN